MGKSKVNVISLSWLLQVLKFVTSDFSPAFSLNKIFFDIDSKHKCIKYLIYAILIKKII